MIEKYIKYLLFEHDCVVIPDFGGFIANYVSADIHPIRHTFVPPSKNIAFNEMLKLNDGLLVAHIANSEGISREQAQKAVKDFTDFVKGEIRQKEKYKFDEIGTLFLNHEQKLQFEPENKVNYLNNSFGLPELEYKPIERTPGHVKFKTKDRPAMMNPEISDEDELILPAEPRRSRSWIWLAIFIPVLLFVAGGAGYFLFLDNGKQALSSFNPFVSMQNNMEEDTTTVDDSFLYGADTLAISQDRGTVTTDTNWTATTGETGANAIEPEPPATDMSTTAGLPAENTLTKTTEVNEKQPDITQESTITARNEAPEVEVGFASPSTPPRYYVIVGGFGVKKNAHKLRNKLINIGNNDAKLIPPPAHNNLLKVSAADYSTFQEAATKAEELKSAYGNSVWVYKF